MPYIDSSYVPTIWQNEVTLIDGQKLNKIESALVNLEYAESLRFGTLRQAVLPLASLNANDVFSISSIGAVQLSNTYTPGGVAVAAQTKFAATPYAVSQAYANSAAIDTTTPASRIAKESVIAQNMKNSISIEFVGAQATAAKQSFKSSGDALSFTLNVKNDAHNHTIKTVSAPATTQTKGFVQLAQDFTTISVSSHTDTVPTAKLFKDEVQKTNTALSSEKTRIDNAFGEIDKIKTVAASLSATALGIGIKNANDSKNWIDTFKDGKLVSIEKSISDSSKEITSLKEVTGATTLKFNDYVAKSDYNQFKSDIDLKFGDYTTTVAHKSDYDKLNLKFLNYVTNVTYVSQVQEFEASISSHDQELMELRDRVAKLEEYLGIKE